MLSATEEERANVIAYMVRETASPAVEFLQKVHSEQVINHRHDVWDVHTSEGRWWVITNPMNLYSQDMFPNMDLAVTFHVGLCIRIPRSEKPNLAGLGIEPFAECYRYLQETSDALSQAEEVADYQTIGVRCRETLLAFTAVGQLVAPWTEGSDPPKKNDFKAWVEHICSVISSSRTNKERRDLFKKLLISAWTFANWLTHTKTSRWHDAETATATTEHAVSLCISSVIQYIRGVPSSCPACGSHRLTPERACNPSSPDEVWERPSCMKCDWTGNPVKIEQLVSVSKEPLPAPEGECGCSDGPLTRAEEA